MLNLNKDEIYEEVHRRVQGDITEAEKDTHGLCFYYAMHGIEVLREKGVRALLQAGSCSWPRINEDKDDGKVLTHFGYIWSPNTLASKTMVAAGGLPEMHIWIGLLEGQEIVDFTTGNFPAAAALMGMDWNAERPPKYLWGKPSRRVLYQPIMQAVAFVLRKVCERWSMDRAEALVK